MSLSDTLFFLYGPVEIEKSSRVDSMVCVLTFSGILQGRGRLWYDLSPLYSVGVPRDGFTAVTLVYLLVTKFRDLQPHQKFRRYWFCVSIVFTGSV